MNIPQEGKRMIKKSTVILISISVFLIISCEDAINNAITQLNQKTLESFTFTVSANPSLYSERTGTIDEEAKTITFNLYTVNDPAGLVADFSFRGASISVDGTEQISGQTANDFSSPVTYTIEDFKGNTVSYTASFSLIPWSPSSGSWKSAAVPFSGTWKVVRIALDGGENPVVAMAPSNGLVNLFTWDSAGSVFTDRGTNGDNVAAADWFDIAVDGTGRIWVSSPDSNASNDIKMYYWDTTWATGGEILNFDGTISPGGSFPGFTLNSLGWPVVVFRDAENTNDDIFVKIYDGAAWGANRFFAGELEGNETANVDLTLIADIPYVVYEDQTGFPGVISNGGAGPSQVGPALGDNNISYSLVIEKDAGDEPWIAYAHRSDNSVLVSHFDGAAWNTLPSTGLPALSGIEEKELDLLFYGGTPLLALATASGIRVMTYDQGSSAWEDLGAGSGAVSPAGATSPDMGVDTDGRLYLTYVDAGSSNDALLIVYGP